MASSSPFIWPKLAEFLAKFRRWLSARITHQRADAHFPSRDVCTCISIRERSISLAGRFLIIINQTGSCQLHSAGLRFSFHFFTWVLVLLDLTDVIGGPPGCRIDSRACQHNHFQFWPHFHWRVERMKRGDRYTIDYDWNQLHDVL